MRIPTTSTILIVGIKPVTLAFASILSFIGLKVLVIDDTEKPQLLDQALNLSTYNMQLLKQIGFEIEANSIQSEFLNQSLTLLANNLCSVIWNTTIQTKRDKHLNLKHNEHLYPHETHFIYAAEDLLIDQKNNDLNFRNAFLLAWRLAGIEQKTLTNAALNSYAKEKEILSEYGLQKKGFQKWRAKLLSNKKTEIHFADSLINLHLSHKRELAAGDILPDLPFYDEQLKTDSSLYNWCKYQHFSIIIFGYLGPSNLFSTARWIQLNYSIQLFYLPPSEKNKAIFDTLDIPTGEKKTLIIRPDRYIAFVNDTVDLDIIDNYLKNILGMKAKADK